MARLRRPATKPTQPIRGGNVESTPSGKEPRRILAAPADNAFSPTTLRFAPLATVASRSMTRSLITEVSSTLRVTSVDELQEIFSDQRLHQIKNTSDITTALQLARDAIQGLTHVTTDIASQSALIVEDIWNHFKKRGQLRHEDGEQIGGWQTSIQRDFHIDKFLSMAVSTRRKINSRKNIIQKHWGVPAVEVLGHQQTISVVLSKPLLDDLADLCQVVSLDQGRDLLQQAIKTRKHEKKGPVTATDDRLRRRDVKLAIEQVPAKPKKRKSATKAHQKSSRRRTASPLPKDPESSKEPSTSYTQLPTKIPRSHDKQTQQSQRSLENAATAAGESTGSAIGKETPDRKISLQESGPRKDDETSSGLQEGSPIHNLRTKSTKAPERSVKKIDEAIVENSMAPQTSKTDKKQPLPAPDDLAETSQLSVKTTKEGGHGDAEVKQFEGPSHPRPLTPSPNGPDNDDRVEELQAPFESEGSPEDTTSKDKASGNLARLQPVTPKPMLHNNNPQKPTPPTAVTQTPSTYLVDKEAVDILLSLNANDHPDTAGPMEAPSIEKGRQHPAKLDDLSSVGQNEFESTECAVPSPTPDFQPSPTMPETQADHESSPSGVVSSSSLAKYGASRRFLISSPPESPTPPPPSLTSLENEGFILSPALPHGQQQPSKMLDFGETERRAADYDEPQRTSSLRTFLARSAIRPRRRGGLQTYGQSRQRKLPPATRAGASSSLGPGQWVSATAIEIVLMAIKPDDYLLVDSAWVSATKISEFIVKHSGCNTRLWIPVHSNKHWMLMAVHFDDHEVHIYNGLPQCEKDLFEIYTAVTGTLDADQQWTRRDHDEWYQSNDCDCGVYLLVAALCDVARAPLPAEVSSLRWRRILSCFIESSAGDTDRQREQGVTRSSRQRQPSSTDEVSNIINAAAVVRQQRLDHGATLGKKSAELNVESSAYDNLTKYLTTCGIEIGLPQIMSGVQSGREELVHTLSRTKGQQSAVEESIRAWDAALKECQTKGE
ncbi:MAG: hypothetical protein Q9218_002997 [Villophora microphyllina]